MEYLPLALLIFVYVAARKLRSFKIEVNFKDDSVRLLDGGRDVDRQLSPRDDRRWVLDEGGGQRRRRRRSGRDAMRL